MQRTFLSCAAKCGWAGKGLEQPALLLQLWLLQICTKEWQRGGLSLTRGCWEGFGRMPLNKCRLNFAGETALPGALQCQRNLMELLAKIPWQQCQATASLTHSSGRVLHCHSCWILFENEEGKEQETNIWKRERKERFLSCRTRNTVTFRNNVAVIPAGSHGKCICERQLMTVERASDQIQCPFGTDLPHRATHHIQRLNYRKGESGAGIRRAWDYRKCRERWHETQFHRTGLPKIPEWKAAQSKASVLLPYNTPHRLLPICCDLRRKI